MLHLARLLPLDGFKKLRLLPDISKVAFVVGTGYLSWFIMYFCVQRHMEKKQKPSDGAQEYFAFVLELRKYGVA